MNLPTRVGVVGVGHLGRHHARLLSTIDGAVLGGVADLSRERAEAAAAVAPRARVVTDARELLDHVDAVTIAVPTVDHLAVARPFLQRGIHVLVEKPMAASLAEAEEMLSLASASGAVLAVGHTERFNPAIALALPSLQTPRFMEVHRLSGFPERSIDIDVIFDLMIHDLDLLLASVRSDVVSIEAVGVHVLSPRTDIANARLRFASGCIANLTASRISRERVRKARFFQHDAYTSIDFMAQDVEVYRTVAPDGGGRPSIRGGKLDVTKDEPLRLELADFVEAAQSGRAPKVTAQAGRAALALATRIAEEMEAAL
jgi:predicted dehydrogenase